MIVNEKPELVNNPDMFEEMRLLIREKNDKINHRAGEHDDLLMSFLIGLDVLLYGNHNGRFFKNISNEPRGGEKDLCGNTNLKRSIDSITQYNNENMVKTLIETREYLDDYLKNYDELQKILNHNQDKTKVDKNSNKMKAIKGIINLNK
jgi:hypothetical protein